MEESNPTQNIEILRSEQNEQYLNTSLKEQQNEEATKLDTLAETQICQDKLEIENSKEEIDLEDFRASGRERASESPSVPPPLSHIQIKIDSM